MLFYRIQYFKIFIQNVHWESKCLNIQILWKPQNKYILKGQLNNPVNSHESIPTSTLSLANIIVDPNLSSTPDMQQWIEKFILSSKLDLDGKININKYKTGALIKQKDNYKSRI